jgi:hypothetical protein
MKRVPIPEARRLADNAGATRILIVYVNDAGEWGFTTHARTEEQRAALGKWAHETALDIVMAMDPNQERRNI